MCFDLRHVCALVRENDIVEIFDFSLHPDAAAGAVYQGRYRYFSQIDRDARVQHFVILATRRIGVPLHPSIGCTLNYLSQILSINLV